MIEPEAARSAQASARGTPGYFEHDADIGVSGCGATPEAAFVAAAEAMLRIMADTAALRDEQHIAFDFSEPDLELAFVTWLNRLLAVARCHGLALRRCSLRREGSRWLGEAWGQTWDDSVVPGTEVKGATLTMLSVREAAGGWEARCVVDL